MYDILSWCWYSTVLAGTKQVVFVDASCIPSHSTSNLRQCVIDTPSERRGLIFNVVPGSASMSYCETQV